MKKLIKRVKSVKSTKNQKMMEQYLHYYESLPIKEKTILYESREGQSLTDSPYAIFRYLLETDTKKEYHHIWTIQENDELNQIIKGYETCENVSFVERNSDDYLRALSSVEYLINNSTFQSFFIKKKNQTYINTWHGTPLKKMGFDMPDNPYGSRNVVRNFFISDYLFSPNEHTTDMYRRSYRLNDAFPGEILEYGYPRMDLTLQDNQKHLKSLFELFNIDYDASKQLIVYAPTWKGKNIHSPRNEVEQIQAEMNYLREQHGDSYNILIKVHPYLYKEASKNESLQPYLIKDVIDTNEILSLTDILITDYSSIFFDFLVTDRPIFFYVWDDDMYVNERGRYFSLDELPGPTSSTIFELAEQISNVDYYAEKFTKNYRDMKKNIVAHDDGHATERYVNHIFNSKSTKEKIKNKGKAKKNLLIYPGGMNNNGITTSFINLVNNVDYSQYNVICFFGYINRKEQIAKIQEITKEAMLLFRFGVPAYTKSERKIDSYIQEYGKEGYSDKNYPYQAYQRELKRLIGNVEIDSSIDFSGYSIYPAKLMLAASDSKKICFIHNDIVSDKEKIVGGKKPHEKSLGNLFTVYNDFDALVSVSKITNEINRENLKHIVDEKKFKYSVNTLNPDKILAPTLNQQESETDPLRIHVVNLKAVVTDAVEVYDKIPLHQTEKVTSTLPANSEIELIAKAIYLEEVYYKIRHEDIYLGWISEKFIEFKPDTIVLTEKVDYFARLNTNARCYLYSKPYKLEGCHTISSAGFLRNLYVNIDEVVTTSNGKRYFHVSVFGEDLGWLNYSNARLSKRLNGRYPSIVTNLLRKITMKVNRLKYKEKQPRIANRLLFEERYQGYAHLHQPVNDTVVCFRDSRLSEPLEEKLILDDENKIVKLLKIADFQGKKVYKIQTSLFETAWVESRYLSEINSETSTPMVFKEDLIEATVLLKEGSDIYHSKTATTFSNDVKKERSCSVEKKIYRTDGRQLYQVRDNLTKELIGFVDSRQVIFDEQHGTFNSAGVYLPYPKVDDETFNFVTVGRFSPEKQQDLLIKSFAEFYQQYDNSHLYIIGSGPLKNDLLQLVSDLDIQEAVTFTGQLSNPYPLMKRCDCFVLTSIYEGQPMVLLESLTLGLPIISTDIPQCRYVLEDGAYGLLTETNDVEGVKNEMINIYQNKDRLTFKEFDYQSYNEQAIQDFYKNTMV